MYCVGLMLMVSVLAGYLVGFVAYLCRLTQFSLSRPHLTRAVLVMGQLTLIRLLPVGQPRSTYGSGHLYAPFCPTNHLHWWSEASRFCKSNSIPQNQTQLLLHIILSTTSLMAAADNRLSLF